MAPKIKRPSDEKILAALNEHETIEAAAAHLKVSQRTLARVIDGKFQRHICWRRIVQIDVVATKIENIR